MMVLRGLALMGFMVFAPTMGLSQALEQNVPVPTTPPRFELPSTEIPQSGDKPTLPDGSSGFDKNRFGERPEDTAYGAYQRGLYKTAFNLAQPLAEGGDIPAILLVAELYARGLGVVRDAAKAAEFYAKAAALGDDEGQLQTALYMLQRLKKDDDTRAVRSLLEQSAASGNALAAFNLAQLIIDERPGPSGVLAAVPYFEQAAKAGLADAQYAMAQMVRVGYGTVLPDDILVRAWLQLAAVQGHDTAQLEYATALIDGIGGERDYKSGYLWMQRAAKIGNVPAQLRLARLYRNGIGVEGNSVLAGAWYIKARRAGLKDARLDVFLEGLDDETRNQALAQANAL